MSQLTFPIVADGLIVDVLVNLEAPILIANRSSGQPCLPIETRGLIDTARNVSGVSATLQQQLGVSPVGRPTSTMGIGGSLSVQLYRVSLHIRDEQRPLLPMLTMPSLLVMDLPPGLACEVLIGMDVLMNCKLTVDGPAGVCTIDF